MASDVRDGGCHEPHGRADQWWPALAGPDGTPSVIDVAFDDGTLHTLRPKVRAHAARAGFPRDRAEEVVLAVHELAANSVRHGGGAGRLRVWNLAGSLRCQVDDGELPGTTEPGPRSASDRPLINPLPCVPGHGLWVVQRVADQVRSLSSPRGTSVTATFGLSGSIRRLPLDSGKTALRLSSQPVRSFRACLPHRPLRRTHLVPRARYVSAREAGARD